MGEGGADVKGRRIAKESQNRMNDEKGKTVNKMTGEVEADLRKKGKEILHAGPRDRKE